MKTAILYRSDRTHFEVTSEDAAMAMLGVGNSDGLNRACTSLPDNMVARLAKRGNATVLELIWPNGDTLYRTSGRIDAKETARKLLALGITVLVEKKGGRLASLSASPAKK